jgi:hypothetical protein
MNKENSDVFDGTWLEYQQSNSTSFKIEHLANSVLWHACYNVQCTIQLFTGTVNQHLGFLYNKTN